MLRGNSFKGWRFNLLIPSPYLYLTSFGATNWFSVSNAEVAYPREHDGKVLSYGGGFSNVFYSSAYHQESVCHPDTPLKMLGKFNLQEFAMVAGIN